MSAYSDLIVALAEHPCCFSDDDAKKLVDAYRDQVALGIGRDALRDGLIPTLNRLVGDTNATKLMADLRNVLAHELAEHIRDERPQWGDAWRHHGEAADLIDPHHPECGCLTERDAAGNVVISESCEEHKGD